jgi:hypothetical protein
MSCPYKYALGIPGQGVHAARILGLSLNDILATFVVAALTAWLTQTSYVSNLVIWFIGGEILHYIFGTPTAFLKMIGLEPSCN